MIMSTVSHVPEWAEKNKDIITLSVGAVIPPNQQVVGLGL